jgi:DNA-binding SARP family transcriptional activator
VESSCVPRWHLGLLGHWRLVRDAATVDVGTRQQRCIAALALCGPRSRGNLAGLLWPDSSEAHAAGNLRTCLFEISHRLPALVRARAGVLELDDVAVDVDGVHRLIHDIESSRGLAASADAIDALTAAELLPGWYDDWVVFEQERLTYRRLVALDALAEAALSWGDGNQAVRAAEAAVAIEPLRESSHLLLMRGHLLIGNRIAAYRAYEHLQDRLENELGIEPSWEFAEVLSLMTVGAAHARAPGPSAGVP